MKHDMASFYGSSDYMDMVFQRSIAVDCVLGWEYFDTNMFAVYPSLAFACLCTGNELKSFKTKNALRMSAAEG